MGARPLTDRGLAMLGTLPPVLRDSVDYQAVIHAAARELDLLEAAAEQVRSQFSPSTADILQDAWELTTGLPVGGAGQSLAQRQMSSTKAVRQVLGAGSGLTWEERITDLIGSGWTYEEHIAGDGSSPAANTIRITLPFPPEGALYAQTLVKIRQWTAAHIAIELASTSGFILDESQLDIQEFTD